MYEKTTPPPLPPRRSKVFLKYYILRKNQANSWGRGRPVGRHWLKIERKASLHFWRKESRYLRESNIFFFIWLILWISYWKSWIVIYMDKYLTLNFKHSAAKIRKCSRSFHGRLAFLRCDSGCSGWEVFGFSLEEEVIPAHLISLQQTFCLVGRCINTTL